MYRIIDTQWQSYFANGAKFYDKKEVLEQLRSYHSVDVDKDWLNSMDLDTIMAEFGWDIEYCTN
jgi:hypothetical protein